VRLHVLAKRYLCAVDQSTWEGCRRLSAHVGAQAATQRAEAANLHIAVARQRVSVALGRPAKDPHRATPLLTLSPVLSQLTTARQCPHNFLPKGISGRHAQCQPSFPEGPLGSRHRVAPACPPARSAQWVSAAVKHRRRVVCRAEAASLASLSAERQPLTIRPVPESGADLAASTGDILAKLRTMRNPLLERGEVPANHRLEPGRFS